MEFVFSPQNNDARIQKSIALFGLNLEHNLTHFQSQQGGEKVAVLFSDGSAVLALHHDQNWRLLAEPIAPNYERIAVNAALSHHLLSRSIAKRVVIESAELARWMDLEKHSSFFRLGPVTRSLHNLIFDLQNWEMEQTHTQKLLHRKRKELFEDKTVKVVSANDVNEKTLKELALSYVNSKGIKEYSQIFAIIDSKFKDMKTRVILKDDEPLSLIAFWTVGETTFAGLHISKPNFDEIVAEYDLLLHLKEKNVKVVSLGKGEEEFMNLRQALMPTRIETTQIFSLLQPK